MKAETKLLLADGLARIAVLDSRPSARSSLAEDLARYIDEILLWNPKLGLIEGSEQDIVVKHVLDSLSALSFFVEASAAPADFSVADIGTGAGLPGIPLVLGLHACGVECTMSLVDSQQRRCGFLLNAVALLGLGTCCEVVHGRLESLAAASFDVVTARAFAPLDPLVLAQLQRCLQPSGRLLLYKGRREKIDAELDDCRTALEGWASEVRQLTVPLLDEERHLVHIARSASTPSA